MVTKICTSCGYEGEAIKRPSDSAGEEGSETRDAFDKLSRTFSVITFIPIKPLALLLALPMYIVLWPIKRAIRGDGKKWCPHCGLPFMVSLKSDAGWLAKRKNDIKSGLVVPGTREPAPVVAFGREIKLPGDEAPAAPAAAPRPEKLPTLEALLRDEKNDSVPAPDTAEKQQENPVKTKPARPDEW